MKKHRNTVLSQRLSFPAWTDRIGHDTIRIQIGNYTLLDKLYDSQMQHMKTFGVNIDFMSVET